MVFFEEIDVETVSEDERRAFAFEEIAAIEQIIHNINNLPTDSKALELSKVLSELKGSGYPQVMVFTQFSDTMDYLRDQVVASGYSVMCYSGRGGDGVHFHDKDGHRRDEVRLRWWDQDATTFRKAAIGLDGREDELPDSTLPRDFR
jgi:hypothetical protein